MIKYTLEGRRRVFKVFCGCFFYLFTALNLSAQLAHSIDLDQIPKKKVRNYLVEKDISSMENYSSIHASWKAGIDESTFRTHEKTFYLKDKLTDVWNCYNVSSPVKSWNGNFVRFCLLISKPNNSVKYEKNTDFSDIDTGQVYFLDLKLLKGLFNVPVAFEIIKVDTINKILEFSYIDGNKTKGKQTLQFFDNGNGSTRIIHRSIFKSESPLRDGVFYPYFHTKIIKQFHRNMRYLIQSMLLTEAKSEIPEN